MRRIKAKELSPLYILKGDDILLQDIILQQLEDVFLQSNSRKKIYYMDIDTEEDFINQLSSFSLFDEKIVIVVKKIKKIARKYHNEIIDYFKSPSKDVVVVFIINDAYYRTKFVDSISTNACLVDTRVPFPGKMKEWVSYLVKRDGIKISDKDLRLLIDVHGDNSINVYNEIIRLQLQVGSNDLIDVDKSDGYRLKKESQVWKLMDYIGKKEYNNAISVYDSLYINNIGIGAIIFNLCNMFREMFTARIDRGQKPGKYLRNKILLKNFNIYTKKYSLEEIKQAIKLLRKCDLLSKTTSVGQKLLIGTTLLEICEAKYE